MTSTQHSTQHRTNASEVFAIVQQISSQVNQDRIQDVVARVEGIDINDKQLVVNLLGMAFEKSHHLLKNADRVLLLLAKIASPANILSQNRIISAEYITSDTEQSSDVYKVIGELPTHVKVMKRGKKNAPEVFSERLLTWAHLSHAKILPVYGAFLDGEDDTISLVSPQMTEENIVDYAQPLSSSSRMLLISDVISGLCYLHNLNIVHGALTPESVCISDSGQAYITDLDAHGAEDSDLCSIRYSAPEMLKDEESLPTKAADMWSLGCLIYEVLSGKVPFHQLRQERKVSVAIVTGKQPTRPGQEGGDANEIGDTIWRPLASCWEFRPEDRPSCPQFQRVLSSMVIHDDRSVPKVIIQPECFECAKGSPLDLDHARSILKQIFGSDSAMPPPSQIPEHLQGRLLSGLAENLTKADAVAVAATKLSPGDTQTLLDVLDLLWEESPVPIASNSPIDGLLTKIMKTTHIFPQHYKINRIRHDPTPLAEGGYGKVYKGQDLDVCISVVTNPNEVSDIIDYLALWAHAFHPNVLPSYGVFHEDIDEIPRLCLVTPYMKNGLLRDYAPGLPQKDRIPLIFDAVNALVYLQGLNIRHPYVRGDNFLVSDEGRAMLLNFGTGEMLKLRVDTSGVYGLHFCAPERATADNWSFEASAWAFGCMMIEVLSRKLAYHQYVEESEIRSALSNGEPPSRPTGVDDDVNSIDDQFWDLIAKCCVPEPAERLTFLEIQKELGSMVMQDDRPEITNLPGAEALSLKSHSNIDWDDVKRLLDQIQVELLRTPLSKLIQNHTKDVSAAAAKLNPDNIQTLVDFLDLALKDHITLSDERNRVLALLSRVTTTTDIFPYRYRIDGIKYHPSPISEGGFGTVHRGVSDPNICVKVTTKVDSKAMMGFVKELILWAHSSHPNVLPFYGVFWDESKRICLVSPFMSKGNLHDYAPRLAQKKRVPLLQDVIKGLIYLHGLGVIHTDLKGENVLISDEGRGLITDFGASHVITATAKGSVTAASVASTLRFTPPEIILNRRARPTQECDFYEVMSRKLPYYEYNLETQVLGALSRGQLPKRPSSTIGDLDDDLHEFDDNDDEDWDEIDDQAWSVIVRCCALKPEERPKASQIQELIVDLKVWDDRPEGKDLPGAHFLKLRSSPDIDLSLVGDLLNELQVRFLAQRTLQHSTADVATAVSKVNFDDDEKWALVEFWDLVLKNHLFTSDENNQALALLSTLLHPMLKIPYRYLISSTITYDRVSIGSGSFGTVHQADDLNLCVKAINAMKLEFDMYQRWIKSIPPSVYSSHPNILPFYGTFFSAFMVFIVIPFMKNGNIYKHALRLPQSARIPLILDITDAIIHLHSLGIVHGNLKGENILITDEGRALVADFAPYHINIAAAEDGPTGPYITSTLRFTAPELVKKSDMLPTTKSDTWSIGCLIYLLLSRKDPFHQYSINAELRSALSRGELPDRPAVVDNLTDTIDDSFWDLITKCCAPDPADRPTLLDIRKFLTNLRIQDNRPPPRPCPGAEILKLRNPHPGVDIERIGGILARIQSELPSAVQVGENEDETTATPN